MSKPNYESPFLYLIIFLLFVSVLFVTFRIIRGNVTEVETFNNEDSQAEVSELEDIGIRDYFTGDSEIVESSSDSGNSGLNSYFRKSQLTPTPKFTKNLNKGNSSNGATCPINGVDVQEGTAVSGETCVAPDMN